MGEECVGLDVLRSSLERDMMNADSRDICINSYVIMCENWMYGWLVLVLPGLGAL